MKTNYSRFRLRKRGGGRGGGGEVRWGGRGWKLFSGESHHPIHSGKTAVQHNRRSVKKIDKYKRGGVWFIWTPFGGRAPGALLSLLNGQNFARWCSTTSTKKEKKKEKTCSSCSINYAKANKHIWQHFEKHPSRTRISISSFYFILLLILLVSTTFTLK